MKACEMGNGVKNMARSTINPLSKMKRLTNAAAIGLAVSLFSSSGCNRATLRIPGASTVFPETVSDYKSKTSLPYRLVIEAPSDHRAQHYGEKVAGTGWKGCATDALS